jgi:hypothetical protein
MCFSSLFSDSVSACYLYVVFVRVQLIIERHYHLDFIPFLFVDNVPSDVLLLFSTLCLNTGSTETSVLDVACVLVFRTDTDVFV